MDAVALFPSLSGKNTAKIVRETAEKTTMELEGFDWKKGMIYVKVKKHLTKIRKEMRVVGKYWFWDNSNPSFHEGVLIVCGGVHLRVSPLTGCHMKHILETSQDNSRTLAIHVKHLSTQYGLPHPLECLKSDPPTKSKYKE